MRKIPIREGDLAAAARAAAYPLEKADSPQAFVRPGETPVDGVRPMWMGTPEALAALGLEVGEEATESALSRALMGRHTKTGERVRKPGPMMVQAIGPDGAPVVDGEGRPVMRRTSGTTSMDLVTSAPKTVTDAWTQASVFQRAGIERAMVVAANAAVDHMIQTKQVVFWGKDKGHEVARGGVWASALHVTSRIAEGEVVPAPQLHVHNMLVGVLRSDGKLVSAQSWAMFTKDAPLEGGAVFRAALADELVKLGYEIEAGTGRKGRFFEIRGVPRGLVEHTSGRSRDVERAAKAWELATGQPPTGQVLGVLATMTRLPKDKSLTPERIMAEWDAIAAEHGFGREEAAALIGRPGYAASLRERQALAREALDRLMAQRGPTVSAGELRAMVFEVAPGRLSLEEAYAWSVGLERSGMLLGLEGERATTATVRNAEQRVLDVAVAAAKRKGPGLSPESVEGGKAVANAGIGGGHTLDREQLEAVEKLTGGSGFSILTGLAGAGKGPTLEAVSVAHRSEGWSVVACAVDGSTAQRLGEQVGARALTLDQVTYGVDNGRLRLDDRTLLVIEEASKVGLRHWEKVADWVERHGIRVLAVGHDGQLGAIELPGMFTALRLSGIPVAQLTEVRRHRDPDDPSKIHPWLRDYQVLLDAGRAEEAVALLLEHDALKMYDTVEQTMVQMVADWDVWHRRYGILESKLIVHGSNRDVDLLNRLAQQRRLVAGDIGQVGVQAVDRDYQLHSGDVVVLANGSYQPASQPKGPRQRRVENGQVGVVEAVDGKRGIVEVRIREPVHGERVVRFDLEPLRERVLAGEERVGVLRLAYASHTFPLQGATVRASAALSGHPTQGKEASYVSDTRGAYEHLVYVAREYLGAELDDRQRLALYVERLKRSQQRIASIALQLDNSQRIAVEVARPTRMPELPGKEASPDRVLDAVPLADPFDAYRELVGEARAEKITLRAERLALKIGNRPLAWLEQRAEQLPNPFEALDPAAARTALRLERERAVVAQRRKQLLKEADMFHRRAEELVGWREREERRAALDASMVKRDLALTEQQTLGRLDRRLATEGRALKDWTRQHGRDAARWVALQRELTLRKGMQLAEEAEQAVKQPPEHLRELLGERPLEATQRQEWDALVRDLERDRLAANHARQHGLEPPGHDRRRRNELAERIDKLRNRSGLTPVEHGRNERAPQPTGRADKARNTRPNRPNSGPQRLPKPGSGGRGLG